jgi:hypothetical protein
MNSISGHETTHRIYRMNEADPIESRLFELILGDLSPLPMMLTEGKLPDEWVDCYLQLLEEADQKWHGRPDAPWELLSALRAATWHLEIRYQSWCSFDKTRDEVTEQQLARLRKPSEALLSSLVERNRR